MVSFDPFLYVAFGAGFLAGRWIGRPVRGVAAATVATIVVLVGLLGASLAMAPAESLLSAIPWGILFAGMILGATLAGVVVLRLLWPPDTEGRPDDSVREKFPLSVVLLGALLLGYGVGRAISVPAAAALPYALYLLLALVAFDLRLSKRALRRLWVPLTASALGATVAAAVFAWVSGTNAVWSFAAAYAFGWYTLAGPLVAARAGASLGLIAFLANFLRENGTMLSAKAVGRRASGEGVAALGGATAMDTTLFFVTRYGDRDGASLALATGLVLTVAASLILPAVLAFAP